MRIRQATLRLLAASSLALGALLVLAVLPQRVAAQPGARAVAAPQYLQLAEEGIARAQRLWRDPRRGWYDERLNDRDRYPLATIWGIVPLFETLNAVAAAAPTPAHIAAVRAFARGAQAYWNASLRPTAGYAPYPHDRGQVRTWFDDNGWWGIALLLASRATGEGRYLSDARRAFAFIAAQGWDAHAGGVWWNTSHPFKSGPALASGALLAALLYERTGSAYYAAQAQRFLAWADANLRSDDGLYADSSDDPTPVPYVEGAAIEAQEILCRSGAQPACERARELADAAWRRFSGGLDMGPQFDTIYVHWMLIYGAQADDPRWHGLAVETAARAQLDALSPGGLYLRAWDGTPITEHQARPGMLQTDAATLELFAWLAAQP